jgi:predicted type IV restriction endonuclease
MDIDSAKERFQQLYKEWSEHKLHIETEQDARFQIIDRMLTSVLGWNYKEIKTEPPTESGFIDYLLTYQGRNRFVVEAKRASTLLIDTRNPRVASYKVSGSALASAARGFDQARRYCADTGVLFAALTTGFEWIAYWAVRADGTSPAEGKAIVFPTLEAAAEKFALFYDLFSREGILQNLYQVRIREAEGLEVQHIESLESVIKSSEVKLRPKPPIATDLRSIYRGFFSTISGDNDPKMLAQCFVESRESREADVSLAKTAQNLVTESTSSHPLKRPNFRTRLKPL